MFFFFYQIKHMCLKTNYIYIYTYIFPVENNFSFFAAMKAFRCY